MAYGRWMGARRQQRIERMWSIGGNGSDKVEIVGLASVLFFSHANSGHSAWPMTAGSSFLFLYCQADSGALIQQMGALI